MSVLIVFLIGTFAGVLSGLLGVGGGVVIVPMLVLILGLSQHTAQGISLVYIIPTAIAGLIQMHRHKIVDYRLAGYVAGGAIIGALLSSNFVQYIPAEDMKKIFGIFVALTGLRMIFMKKKSSKPAK